MSYPSNKLLSFDLSEFSISIKSIFSKSPFWNSNSGLFPGKSPSNDFNGILKKGNEILTLKVEIVQFQLTISLFAPEKN